MKGCWTGYYSSDPTPKLVLQPEITVENAKLQVMKVRKFLLIVLDAGWSAGDTYRRGSFS